MSKPKILLYDIETSPIHARVWGLWGVNVGLSQIIKDTHMISWSAKWLDAPTSKTMYMDQRSKRDISDDRDLVQGIKNLIEEADIVITHNGIAFDEKVINTRLLLNGLSPLKPVQHIDTYRVAKRKLRLTSNKLEYLARILKVPFQKLVNRKFQGQDLWTQCELGNKAAWDEMKKYNKLDTLVLEAVYKKISPWDNSTGFEAYYSETQCTCGSQDIIKKSFRLTNTGKYQGYMCKGCGKRFQGKENLIHKERRKNMLKG